MYFKAMFFMAFNSSFLVKNIRCEGDNANTPLIKFRHNDDSYEIIDKKNDLFKSEFF
jgi:hypothetical protein